MIVPLAALAGDDRCDAAVGEPLEQPLDLGADDDLVLEGREEDLDGVEDDALGADGVDLGAEPHEQALEVVLAGLLHLAALDADVVEGEQALLLELLEVEALRGEVDLEVARGLLEADEQPGIAVLLGAVDQEAHGEDGLAAAGGAGDERDAALGQASLGDLVEALYARGDLGQ